MIMSKIRTFPALGLMITMFSVKCEKISCSQSLFDQSPGNNWNTYREPIAIKFNTVRIVRTRNTKAFKVGSAVVSSIAWTVQSARRG